MLQAFLERFPRHLMLAVEFRHPGWFTPEGEAGLIPVLEASGVAAVITDVAGRRDVAHMHLSAPFTLDEGSDVIIDLGLFPETAEDLRPLARVAVLPNPMEEGAVLVYRQRLDLPVQIHFDSEEAGKVGYRNEIE